MQSSFDKPLLIVGGAPQLAIDAVRYITVGATGETAVNLWRRLKVRGVASQLLLSADAQPQISEAARYRTRHELDLAVRSWVANYRTDGTIILIAAINDYRVQQVHRIQDGQRFPVDVRAKLPSGCDEVRIQLAPAPKLVDTMRNAWGFLGRIVCFKHEEMQTVIASARALQHRVQADCVVANSLCGHVQALVTGQGVHDYGNRQAVLAALVERLAGPATVDDLL